MRYLGIDYGTQRIGLALGSNETSAVPLSVISEQGSVITAVIDIIKKEGIDVVVIGKPQHMHGKGDGEIEKEIQKFIADLQSRTTIIVERVDERLTSKAADAMKKEFGGSGQRDAVAAMLILDSYLQRKK
ncbi:Holliday junction resolvase RuvX [Candidatus Uhrbacteria bacterium]|nr:Holliday junction resolvase RuvX [Candidatus Uhrbacteria bacterium]